MRMRGVLLVGVMVGVLGCTENTPPAMSAPAHVAADESKATTIDDDLSKRIGVLSVSSGLNADLTLVRAKSAAVGMVMEDGTRYAAINLVEDAGKSKDEVVNNYADVIRDTKVDDLKAALKAGMAAEIAFYDTALDAGRYGDPKWLLDLQAAREAIRQSDSKVEVEKRLAKAK